MTFEQAAGVPIAAETAYRALHEAGKIERGQTVLIHGAAGGVGSAAVQIAKAAGARVIGTASPNNHEFLRSLGVDQVIDYRSQKFEDVVQERGPGAQHRRRRYQRAFHRASCARVACWSRSSGPPNAAACAAAKIRCAVPDRETGASQADLLARVGELADAGKFKMFVEAELIRWPMHRRPGKRAAQGIRAASSSSRCRKVRR